MLCWHCQPGGPTADATGALGHEGGIKMVEGYLAWEQQRLEGKSRYDDLMTARGLKMRCQRTAAGWGRVGQSRVTRLRCTDKEYRLPLHTISCPVQHAHSSFNYSGFSFKLMLRFKIQRGLLSKVPVLYFLFYSHKQIYSWKERSNSNMNSPQRTTSPLFP